MDSPIALVLAAVGAGAIITGGLLLSFYTPSFTGRTSRGVTVTTAPAGIRPAWSLGIITAGALLVGLALLLMR